MLSAADRHYERQAALILVGLRAAERAWGLGRPDLLATTLATLQIYAAREAEFAVNRSVIEQGLLAPMAAAIAPNAFRTAADGRSLVSLLEQADSLSSLFAMTTTQIADTGRVAAGVALTARPNLSGYIRNVGATCCSRCAILAGRFYRYSDDFQRHINCKCTMVATTTAGYGEYIETPDDLFQAGRINDLTVGQRSALEDGADISRVINANRGGLSPVGGGLRGTTERADGKRARLTPYSIYKLATSRDEAIRLLVANGYLV